jgi:YtoQ family protein
MVIAPFYVKSQLPWVVSVGLLTPLRLSFCHGDVMEQWQVYLSGEIHSSWREQIIQASQQAHLALSFSSAVTDHEASDSVGVEILGTETQAFWQDHKAAKINAIRNRSLIAKADIVVVRFGDKYRQWNAAFDAGYAVALGKSLITLHSQEHQHALKEVDSLALAVAETPQQVVEILRYVSG